MAAAPEKNRGLTVDQVREACAHLDWPSLVVDQGLSEAAQIDHLRKFIESKGLVCEFVVFARAAISQGADEADDSGDLYDKPFNEARLLAADSHFSIYDFGDDTTVVEAGAWERDDDGDVWSRPILCVSEGHPRDGSAPQKATFTVRFGFASSLVEDAWASDGGKTFGTHVTGA